MQNFSYVEVKVDHPGPEFLGVELYSSGDTLYGVKDNKSDNIMCAVKGTTVIFERAIGEGYYLQGPLSFSVIENIGQSDNLKDLVNYCKSIELESWFQTTNIGIIHFIPKTTGMYANDVEGGRGGAEFLSSDEKYLCIIKDGRYITQIRKGAVFYLSDLIPGEEIVLNKFDYEMLKEVRFIYENDYKAVTV